MSAEPANPRRAFRILPSPRRKSHPRRWGRSVGAVLFALLWAGSGPAGAAEGIGPGAYCPLPEKGEVPQCLLPAQDNYEDFFTALDGDAEPEALLDVETAVARGAEAEEAYLALTSLTYGYYRLAQRAAAHDETDPAIVARLSRWNDLLSAAYSKSADDDRYRAAVERAVAELQVKAPVTLPCRDAQGEEAACNSTEAVLRGFNAASEKAGIRGALERLMRRLFGSGEET